MIAALALGGVFGVAVLVALRAARPAPEPLPAALRRLHPGATAATQHVPNSRLQRLAIELGTPGTIGFGVRTAEQAARAGAQGLSIDQLRVTGAQTLDPDRAAAAAHDYLGAVGHRGTVAVDGGRVTVTVAIPRRPLILGIGGLRTVTVTGQATARNARGVVEVDQ